MEQVVNSMWPLVAILVILIGLLVSGIIHHQKHPERMVKTEILLPTCYTVNSMCNILIHGLLPEKENVEYESYFFWLFFSLDGDVYIRRQFNGRNICWERFGQNGESLGLVKKAEIRRMEEAGEIFQATALQQEPDGRITAISVIFEKL